MERIQPALTELRAAFAALSRNARIALGAGALILACVLCSLGTAVGRAGGTGTTPTATTGSAQAAHATNTPRATGAPRATATSKTQPTATTLPKVGSTITLDNVSTTLVSVTPISGDDFTQPKAGNEFVVVTVKIMNHSGSEQSYNEFDFHVRTGSGNITDSTIGVPSTYTANNQLNSGHLTNGGTVSGDLIFEVPTGDHNARLTWQPSFFGNTGDNGWLLGL